MLVYLKKKSVKFKRNIYFFLNLFTYIKLMQVNIYTSEKKKRHHVKKRHPLQKKDTPRLK